MMDWHRNGLARCPVLKNGNRIDLRQNDATHQANPEFSFICYHRAPVIARLPTQPAAKALYGRQITYT
jgi:hypothetical protein